MKQGALICITTAAALAMASCTTPASDQEVMQMCQNLVKVRGDVKVPLEAELIADVDQNYARQKDRLVDWKNREMKSWDDELAARLKVLADDPKAVKPEKGAPDPKVVLEEEYARKKKIGAEQFDKDIEALGPARELAIKAAKEKIAMKTEEFEAAKKDCVEKARAEGVSQAIAQCRITAPDTDSYWNKCR